MLNKVMLIGNLGADPEVRTTASGSVVATLRIATTERRKDKEGNWTDQTEWHNVVCFGRTAENVQRFLSKGSKVYVEGRLQTRKWQDKEGKDRWSTEIVADDVRFLDSKGSRGDRGGEERPSQRRGDTYQSGQADPLPPQVLDEDVPF